MPRGLEKPIQCHLCHRTFSRAEHRDRHLATHNNLRRPFRCNFCYQEFQRTDSLRRHVDKYCADNVQSSNGANNARSRVRSACDFCHNKKLKCDGKKPCRKCVATRHDCTFERSDRCRLPQSAESLVTVEQHNESTPVEPQSLLAISAEPTLEEPLCEIDIDSHSSADPASSSLPDVMFGTWAGGMDVAGGIPPTNTQAVETPCTNTTTMQCLSPGFDLSGPLDWIDSTFLSGLGNDFFALNDPMLVVPPNPWDGEMRLPYMAELLDLDEAGSRFDDQTTRWLQMPLIPRKYDMEMLNALLGVFTRHISGTFHSFQDFTINSSTLPEQILAMASVGCLFVNIKGSSRVARMLFTDCNRMLNNFLLDYTRFPRSTAISLVQSFLASEIFGICGGHPRSCELSEAYHHMMIQVLYVHGLLSGVNLVGNEKIQRERLLSDIFLLESYRTSLFQLKPILTPASLTQRTLGAEEPANNVPAQDLNCINHQASCLAPLDPSEPGRRLTMGNLASVSIGSWLASGQWTGYSYEATNRAWEPLIIHESVNSMLRHSAPSDDPSVSLFGHMIIVALHAPLTDISEAACSVTVERAPTSTVMQSIQGWCRSFDVDVALEHALRIIQLATQNASLTERSTSQSIAAYIEAPHDALCIFNAALVAWASNRAMLCRTPRVGLGSTGPIEQAVYALTRMRVALARSLCEFLQSIIEFEGSSLGLAGKGRERGKPTISVNRQ